MSVTGLYDRQTYSLEINHFIVVYSVTWPLKNGSKAGGDLTELLLLCKSTCFNAN